MATLSIDIETYSDVSIKDGVYRYVDSDKFEILLIGYAFDDEPAKVLDIVNGERLPSKVALALVNPDLQKFAFNAQFERVCLDKFLGTSTKNWTCSMIKAWSLGITGGLDKVGEIVGLTEDEQKLLTGKNLIRTFCMPKKAPKARKNKEGTVYTRTYPEDEPEKWELFKDYCKRDVDAERAINKRLERFKTTKEEHELYQLDQKINDAGVRLDLDLAKAALAINETQTKRLTKLYKEVTGLENPNSLAEIKKLIKDKTGKTVASINKQNIEELMDKLSDHPELVTALDVRRQLSKTSISKYRKMLDIVCSDGRARGLLQFYGAGTGRWAGRLIQVQNLPRNMIEDVDTARDIIKTADLDMLEMMYEDAEQVLSQCIRTAIIPPKGNVFVVSDFSAIEARVIAWVAGEGWRQEVFATHGKIYEASASQMFNVPLEEIDKDSPLRRKGKISELALGYQGSVGALKTMGAVDEMGLEEDELKPLVDAWRKANPNIVKLWYELDRAAKEAIRNRKTVKLGDYLTLYVSGGILFIELPSGRALAYPKPRVEPHEKFIGKDKITFAGKMPGGHKWGRVDTYGGKLTENCIQGIARDCLAVAMLRLDREGYRQVMHVHDEVIVEVDETHAEEELEKINAILGRPLPWAKGLKLVAEGFVCTSYRKG